MSRFTKADQIRAQIAELEAEKVALEKDHAAKLAAVEAKIEQAETILGMFVTTRRRVAVVEPVLPLGGDHG